MTYLLAVLAAAAFGTNWVLQQHEAAQAPDRLELHPVRLLAHLIRRPLWLAGIVALVIGSSLQEAALATGSLSIVETILVLNLVFALLLANRLSPHSVRRSQWLGAFGIVVSLAALLFVGQPSPGHGTGSDWNWLWVGVAYAVVVSGLSIGAWHVEGRLRAVLCATAAGLLFGVSDVLSKATFDSAAHNPLRFVVTWYLYATIATAIIGVMLSQVAFHAAPLAVSLPSLAIGEPVAGLFVGIMALHVTFRAEGWPLVVECLAALGILVGSLEVGRSKVLDLATRHHVHLG